VVAISWVATIFTFGYMFPWAVAATRGRSNHGSVAVVNFMLGWTFIGWVVALAMACSSHQPVGSGGQPMVVIAQHFPRG